LLLCALASCKSEIVAIDVSPAHGSADHAAAPPLNQVIFGASARYDYPPSAHAEEIAATWSVSDETPVKLPQGYVNGALRGGNSFEVTCLSSSPTPITVSASAPASADSTKIVTGTSTLDCR
jgi:hypothetical protein